LRITILSASSGKDRCSAFASSILWRAHSDIALFIHRQDHRHCLRVDRLHDGVGLRGQEAIDEVRSGDCPRTLECRVVGVFPAAPLGAGVKLGVKRWSGCQEGRRSRSTAGAGGYKRWSGKPETSAASDAS
jgi:hypothetical protein